MNDKEDVVTTEEVTTELNLEELDLVAGGSFNVWYG